MRLNRPIPHACSQVGNQAFLTARRTLYIVILDLSYTPPVVVDGSGLANVEWGEEEELRCLKSYVTTLMTHVPSCTLVLVGTKVGAPSVETVLRLYSTNVACL